MPAQQEEGSPLEAAVTSGVFSGMQIVLELGKIGLKEKKRYATLLSQNGATVVNTITKQKVRERKGSQIKR